MAETTLTRRSFVKASALVGATAAFGASMAGCMQEAPQEQAPSGGGADEGLVRMKTSCHGCIQMCPAIAYLKDGVVVKLEGDPDAPVSRGSLCIKGLNQLHTMYSPRRVLHPLRRAGERGENKWEVISWDEAVEEAATHICDAIDKYGPYSFFASVGGGGAYSFMEAMTLPMAFGSPTVFEPGCAQCYLPRWSMSKLFYGGNDQSIADNAVQEIFRPDPDNKAEVVVLWGAQPSVSQTAESGRGMAELRAKGVKTIVVDPNFSPDAVKADVWLPVRPVTYNNGFDGMFSDMYGIGAVIGMSDAENEARAKKLGEENPQQKLANQLLVDRLGMKDHKGLYAWCHSHIPTVREAIATGEPYKPRVWFDMSGNKLAMLGNAKSWYDVFPEVDYIIGQYPMLTSFHIEAADLVFPVREWLEEPMVNMTQLNTQWLQNECVHIGETVSHSIPAAQVVAKCAEKMGGELPGLKPGYLGSATEEEVKASVAETLHAPSWDELVKDADKYVPYVTPASEYFHYGQHETVVDDGLPAGFGTESRKIEVYCQILLKLARTGYPFCYPEPQEPCEDYSPICSYIEPAESPLSDEEYPFVLTSGRVPYFHHGTMRHAALSRELFPTAEIRINPASAKELGIEHMDWVKVTSRRGEVHARAYLTEGVHPKTVWMERFWNPECYDESQTNPTAGWRECNVNVLTKNDAPFNEVYGSYTNRGFTVKIEKSQKPANVWVEPEEFAPFLPTEEMLSEAQTKDVF